MKKGKILSVFLLSILALSIIGPITANAVVVKDTVSISDARVYSKELQDQNGDKIDDKLERTLKQTDDKLERTLKQTDDLFVDLVVKFRQSITKKQRILLNDLGAQCFENTWDQGRRIHIRAGKTIIPAITKLDGVSLITSAETHFIMVAIEGSDFSELATIETTFDDSEIFWNVGCALIRDFSGVENDINLLGDYDIIADVTDLKLHVHNIPDPPTNPTLKPQTQATAEAINATALWDLNYKGGGVKVGNIDTGINADHVDFTGRIIQAKSFVLKEYGYDQDDPSTEDDNGHGSHTSGTILGDGSGNDFYIGVAPDALLYFARILGEATLPSMVAALNWIVSKGVDVINLSFGGGDSPGYDVVETAFRNAVVNHEIPCSISAGNEGADGYYTAGSPGTADEVITVGALDTSYTEYDVAYFSSRGPSADDHLKPDVLAPGVEIVSCSRIGDGYTTMSGTSMAAPHVTGAMALLIGACVANGIDYSPGLIKAALMKTSILLTPLSVKMLALQGRGYINVGAAWDYILKADRIGDQPIVGACNPVKAPIHFWHEILQGQTLERYLTCVSSFAENLTLEITGDAAQYINAEPLEDKWTNAVKLTFNIPTDASLGEVTGEANLKFNGEIIDTADIEFEIVPGNDHKMLLNYRTTNWGMDHMYGQYSEYTSDILDNEFVLSEQNTILNSSILENYDAVWFPDPFSYTEFEEFGGGYEATDTYNMFTEDEAAALHDYVTNDSGTVFFCFLGHVFDAEGAIVGNNITYLNEFTDEYGIHTRDTVWEGASAIPVNTLNYTALGAEVSAIDHYGGSLSLSGDAVQVTELVEGSEYATLAYTQTASGGRVIVMTTNFGLDTDGYQNKYNYGTTQNDIFGMNLIRWATAHHRIQRQSITDDGNVTVTLTYEYVSGPGANFGGFVKTPSGGTDDLTWTEESAGVWTTTYTCAERGYHHFYPECGETGVDEFDYYSFFADLPETTTTPPTTTETPSTTETGTGDSGLGPVIVILIGSMGLASWYLLSRRRK
jgi:hypothetical protein